MNNALTDVPGIKVGHYTDLATATGCTVILCEAGAVAGVDIRGSAPATRETALLDPTCLVERVHAVLLTGGSAFGLDAAGGVMRYLAERGVGFPTQVAMVPIVPAAALFDLAIGRPDVHPGADAGYAACLAAAGGPVAEGGVGAGTGAMVGKLLGPQWATKSGIGTASFAMGDDVVVAAIAAVNAFGDVRDTNDAIIAGPRRPSGGFVDTMAALRAGISGTGPYLANTTLGLVATNAPLTKAEANKVAAMAQDGLALAVRPVHTMYDGDVVFALALGPPDAGRADVSAIGSIAAELLAAAIRRGARQASGLAGIPSAAEWLARKPN